MRLSHAKTNIRNDDSIETRAATVQLNSTIVHVLSRDLYTKPVESMFREILVNAFDSHVEAGQTRPVEIKVPSAFDELWYIRDYGTGIPHDKFMDIYMDYGNSTRRMSDEYTGAFGLGCKSPLAYKSAFQVRSFYDGVERLYLIYYNEDNIPQVDLRSETSTLEPNGIEVSLTMNSSYDYAQFQEAANKLLPRIEPSKYLLVGNNPWFIASRDTSNFQVYGGVSFYESKTASIDVVMGVVAYSLDPKEVLKLLDNINYSVELCGHRTRLFSVLTSLLQTYSLEINAALGEYPIHPSREFINVTPRAVKKLAEDVTKALQYMVAEQNDSFSTDIFLSRLGFPITRLQEKRLKIRIIRPRYGWYSNNYSASPVVSTYDSFLECLKQEKKSILFSPLSSDLMVHYLGNNRISFDHPIVDDLDLKQYTLVFYEKDLCPEFEDLIKDCPSIDLSEQAAAYSSPKDSNWSTGRSSCFKTPRSSSPLLKDKKHNVLVIQRGDGSYKKCWESAQHNVETLKELGVPVYWVPVNMGCLKDTKHRELVELYTKLKSFRIKNFPLLIGLPASKGTKLIEQNFSPIEDFSLWVAQYITTDSFIRRLRMYKTQVYINHEIEYLDPILDYSPAKFLHRILKSHSTRKVREYIQAIPNLFDAEPFQVQHLIDDIVIKFPISLFRSFHFPDQLKSGGKYEAAFKQWVQFVNSLNEVKTND